MNRIARPASAAVGFAIAAALLAPVSSSAAQANGADSSAATTEPQEEASRDEWGFEVDLGLSGALGNNEFLIMTTRYQLEHERVGMFEWQLSAELRYGESKGSVIARRLKGGLDFEFGAEAHWSPFINTQLERDPFRRIDVRSKAGAGVNYNLSTDRNNKTTVSILVLHDYEAFTEPRGRDAVLNQTNARWSMRAIRDRRTPGGFRVQHETTINAVHDSPSDYDIDSTTKCSRSRSPSASA